MLGSTSLKGITKFGSKTITFAVLQLDAHSQDEASLWRMVLLAFSHFTPNLDS